MFIYFYKKKLNQEKNMMEIASADADIYIRDITGAIGYRHVFR